MPFIRVYRAISSVKVATYYVYGYSRVLLPVVLYVNPTVAHYINLFSAAVTKSRPKNKPNNSAQLSGFYSVCFTHFN